MFILSKEVTQMGFFKKAIKTIFKPVINGARGAAGERKVTSKLNPLIFGRVEHKQMNDLILRDDFGKTHQIDHVEIRHNGIFCIETKNYAGRILGSEENQCWTQILPRVRNQLPNPIKQNKSHVYHLNRALRGRYKIHSVIVMVQNNADTIGLPYVINLDDLKNYLAKFDDGTYYSLSEMEEIYRRLMDARSGASHREHVKNIKKTQKDISKNICPRCGKKLVLKESPYGSFYGCSDYPRCRFTKKES